MLTLLCVATLLNGLGIFKVLSIADKQTGEDKTQAIWRARWRAKKAVLLYLGPLWASLYITCWYLGYDRADGAMIFGMSSTAGFTLAVASKYLLPRLYR